MADRQRSRRLAPTISALADAGAPALELGFPFSDPIADGPVLEAACDRALRNGTTWRDLLAQLRVASAWVPTAVMTYANPVWSRGLPTAARELREAGASGLIVPDLSLEEAGPWRTAARAAGLELVLLGAPSADRARIARLARASRGFLYLVSRYGTTGGGSSAPASELGSLVRAARRAAPSLPVLLGFGVRSPKDAVAALSADVDGIVVGSALEELIGAGSNPAELGRWFGRIVRAANP